MEENTKLKNEVQEFILTISAQKHEIEALKIEINVLKKTLQELVKPAKKHKKKRRHRKRENSVIQSPKKIKS